MARPDSIWTKASQNVLVRLASGDYHGKLRSLSWGLVDEAGVVYCKGPTRESCTRVIPALGRADLTVKKIA